MFKRIFGQGSGGGGGGGNSTTKTVDAIQKLGEVSERMGRAGFVLFLASSRGVCRVACLLPRPGDAGET